MKQAGDSALPTLRLAFLTIAAVAIHGYHVGVEDAEIFIPGAKKFLQPELYPYAPEFFLTHERLSLFSAVLGSIAKVIHLSMDWTVCLLYVASLFATLASCWMLAALCFKSPRARWCSILVIMAVLTMPATNTGLLLMDPYLTARSLSTPLILFALASLMQRRYAFAVAATLAAATLHPQMTLCFMLLAGVMRLTEKSAAPVSARAPVLAGATALLPVQFDFAPAQGPYREALYARDFFFLSNWTWYHWLGMLAPLAILAWFARGKFRETTQEFRQLSWSLIPFGLISIAVAAVFTSSHTMDTFARLQPLRCFQLITLVFVVLLGGVVGEYAAKGREWMLAAIFVPLACGMFFVERFTYPFSPHIEGPWATTSSNHWVNALLWIRENTPKDAVFAVDSRYFKEPGVDVHGFRSISERSALADYFKDGGAVAMFPQLANEWKEMSDATYGLNSFGARDFARLASQYPVDWTVIHGSAPENMQCPYQRDDYSVCRIAGSSLRAQAAQSPHS